MSVPLSPRQWAQQDSLGKMATVAMGKITYSQYDINEEKAARIAKAMRAGKTMPPPVGSMQGGLVTIHDGHHRVAAAVRNGKKSIRVKVF
jgi:hypothetical protein